MGDKDGNDVPIPGVLAAGEAACASVHGANRLGANSLLDLVVFGRAAAECTKQKMTPGMPHRPLPKNAGDESIALLDKLRYSKGKHSTAHIRTGMQRTMQKY